MRVFGYLFCKWRVFAGRREAEIMISCLNLQTDGKEPLGRENLMFKREELCWSNSLNRKRGCKIVLDLLV